MRGSISSDVSSSDFAEEVILLYDKDPNKKIVFKKGLLEEPIDTTKIKGSELVLINIPETENKKSNSNEFYDDFVRDQYHCIVEIPKEFKPVQKNGITILVHGELWEEDPEFEDIIKKSGLAAGWNSRGFLFAATEEYKSIIDDIYDLFKSGQTMLYYLNASYGSPPTVMEILNFDKEGWIKDHPGKD